MVEKEGSSGEKDAFKAYKAAREEHEHATESDDGDKVSSALIGRVRTISFIKSSSKARNKYITNEFEIMSG